MVFFVCEGCNESMKKNQVDKHALRCRSCNAVTCVDCSTTFYGNDYVTHTTCVSEAEKYEKTLYKGPKIKANPQDTWNTVIDSATASSETAPSTIRNLLDQIKSLANIPRNEKKFVNFMKNSLRLHNEVLIGELWRYINQFKSDDAASPSKIYSKEPSSANGDSNKNGTKNYSSIDTPVATDPIVKKDNTTTINSDTIKKLKLKKRKLIDEATEANIKSIGTADEITMLAATNVSNHVNETVECHEKKKTKKKKNNKNPIDVEGHTASEAETINPPIATTEPLDNTELEPSEINRSLKKKKKEKRSRE